MTDKLEVLPASIDKYGLSGIPESLSEALKAFLLGATRYHHLEHPAPVATLPGILNANLEMDPYR